MLGAVGIADAREREIPPLGLVELEDPETGERIVVNTSNRAFRSAFRAVDAARRESLDRLLRRSKVDVIDISTGEPWVKPLMRFFQGRMRRQ